MAFLEKSSLLQLILLFSSDFIGTTDTNGTNGRAVHMVTPIQSNQTPISGLTPIMVSQDQNGTNLTHIIASSQQLAGKVRHNNQTAY